MKSIYKLAAVFSILVVVSGCTGTTYNADRTCSEDYVLIPALSIPAAIGACDSYEAK